MAEQASTELISLDDLKDLQPLGKLIYTNANPESGVIRGGVIHLEGPAGVDQVLMDIDFKFNPYMSIPHAGIYWMDREVDGVKESLKYHPIQETGVDPKIVRQFGMKTRINYFGNDPSNGLHDTVEALLQNGYEVLVAPLHSRLMDRLFHFKTNDGQYEVQLIMHLQ